jgi:hypothetical protein
MGDDELTDVSGRGNVAGLTSSEMNAWRMILVVVEGCLTQQEISTASQLGQQCRGSRVAGIHQRTASVINPDAIRGDGVINSGDSDRERTDLE